MPKVPIVAVPVRVLFHDKYDPTYDTYEAYAAAYGPKPSVLTSHFRLTNLEYAVQVSLHRFLHTFQAHSVKRGMSLNMRSANY